MKSLIEHMNGRIIMNWSRITTSGTLIEFRLADDSGPITKEYLDNVYAGKSYVLNTKFD